MIIYDNQQQIKMQQTGHLANRELIWTRCNDLGVDQNVWNLVRPNWADAGGNPSLFFDGGR